MPHVKSKTKKNMTIPAATFAAIVLSLLYFVNKSSKEPDNEPNQNKNQSSSCKFSAKTNQDFEKDVLSKFRVKGLEIVNADIVSDILSSYENQNIIGVLMPTSLKDILKCRVDGQIKTHVQVKIVEGFDAFDFGKGKPEFIDNSMVQVASQFNFLESTSDNHMNLNKYAGDPTQGPRASLVCPGMLAHRNAFFKHKGDLDIQPFFGGLQGAYKRGYFTPSKIKEGENRSEALRYVSSYWRELRVLVQSGKTVFGSETTQVFMAAPSFQDTGVPEDENLCNMCRTIVGGQYEALGVLAALQSKDTARPVNLHVTLVGQGAFNNPPDVLKASFSRMLKALEGHNVIVYIHAYSGSDVRKVEEALSEYMKQNEIARIARIEAKDFLR